MRKTKIKKIVYFSILLFLTGIIFGNAFFSLRRANASAPSTSQGTSQIFYDESWTADEVYVTEVVNDTDLFYRRRGLANLPAISGAVISTANGSYALQPNMVVKRWKVHGHIHFQ